MLRTAAEVSQRNPEVSQILAYLVDEGRRWVLGMKWDGFLSLKAHVSYAIKYPEKSNLGENRSILAYC